MKPYQLELPDIYRGCTWPPITLEWKDDNGNPFNLDGWEPFAFSTRFNLNARVTDRENGITKISMSKTDTDHLRLGVDHWDWIWVGEGKTYPPALAGTVAVRDKKSVT